MIKKVLALGFLLGVMVVPFSLATDPTPAQIQASIKIDQAVVQGAPIAFFNQGGLVIAPPPGATPEAVEAIRTRMETLLYSQDFRGAWAEFLTAVIAAGNAVCTSPDTCFSFNLETIPQLLLARPKLLQALATGVISPGLGDTHPTGITIIIERKYGDWVWTCPDGRNFWWGCLWGKDKDCNTDLPGTQCYKDTKRTQPCPTCGDGEGQFPAEVSNNSNYSSLNIP